MATQRLGIIMHGVTGRMGLNQHLVRSIVAIRKQGGVTLSNGDRVMPDPILVGRNAEKVAALAKQYGIERSTSDLDAALKNPDDTLFFDAATTQMRTDLITRALPLGDERERQLLTKFAEVTRVYGALHGVRGIVNEDFIDLTECTTQNLLDVAATPSSGPEARRR